MNNNKLIIQNAKSMIDQMKHEIAQKFSANDSTTIRKTIRLL